MKSIKILKNVVIGNQVAKKGEERSLENDSAKRLIQRGFAEAVKTPEAEPPAPPAK